MNKLHAEENLSEDANPGFGDSEQISIKQLEDLQAQVLRKTELLDTLAAERNSLQTIASSLQEEVELLRHALSQAAADDGAESIVKDSANTQVTANALESITLERDELRQKLRVREEAEAELRVTMQSLREQLEQQDSGNREQLAELRQALESEQQRLAVLQAESNARDAQLESLGVESSQKDVDIGILQDELDVARQQIQDMKLLVEQGDERTKSLEDDFQDSARKSHEDLKRKNDIEKEMQGQIDRLRKQLEQTSRDYQKSRVSAQEDLDNLRDELHAERQARAEERAQMAARQRELKEQLAAVATEHEVNFSNQSDVIEEAVGAMRVEERNRLQGVLDAHAATEEQLVKLQQELQQARAEMVVFRHQERERHQADINLMEEQYRQAETAIKQLESQLRQLTRERDSALEEQNELREKINTLRGEVEVARGLMNVAGPGQLEDPARLRIQLDETRKNVEIAVRLRAEAEAARDRLLNERNALLGQLENASGANMPLYIPSLDESETGNSANIPQPAGTQAYAGPAGQIRAGISQPPASDANASSWRVTGWLGWLAGLTVVGVIAVAGWWLVDRGSSESTVVATEHATVPQNEATRTLAPLTPATTNGHDFATMSAAPTVQVAPEPETTQTRQLSLQPHVSDDPDSLQLSQPVAGISAAAVAASEGKAAVGMALVSAPTVDLPAESHISGAPAMPKSTRSAKQAVLRTFSDPLKSGGEGPVMVEFAVAGYFMGSYGNSLNFEEGPRHLVKLPGFSIGKYEVTFAEYDRFARATGVRLPYDETWGRGDRPVINVSWADAQDFVDWLSVETGHKYRLPSEAEWEYAARGGSYWMYWWMAAQDAEVTDGVWANCHNCGSEWDGARTAPIGQFLPNAYGLYDMTGNVQEWTADCYHESYDGAPLDGSAWVRPHCSQRVVRGGGYTSPLDTLRSAKRGQLDQYTRLDNLGFRVVREN